VRSNLFACLAVCLTHVLLPPSPPADSVGKTKSELRDYSYSHQVGYTFALGEFVPDPEAPLIKVGHASGVCSPK